MLNKATLIGSVGGDPQIREVGDNHTKVASLSLATTEKYRNQSGEITETTEWHNVVIWGKLAEVVEKYVKTGSQLYVEGKIHTESYEKDGIKRYATKIVAREIKLLGRKSDNTQSQQSSSPQPQQGGAYQPPQGPPQGEEDDDLPF